MMDVDEGGSASTEGGSPPTRTELPEREEPSGPVMSDADVKKLVKKLLRLCEQRGYDIVGKEHLTTKLKIVNGRVVANLKILGFPVNELLAMLNRLGTGLCRSMQPFAVMLESDDDLLEDAPLVIIDIHPEAADWKAGSEGRLDEDLIAEV